MYSILYSLQKLEFLQPFPLVANSTIELLLMKSRWPKNVNSLRLFLSCNEPRKSSSEIAISRFKRKGRKSSTLSRNGRGQIYDMFCKIYLTFADNCSLWQKPNMLSLKFHSNYKCVNHSPKGTKSSMIEMKCPRKQRTFFAELQCSQSNKAERFFVVRILLGK